MNKNLSQYRCSIPWKSLIFGLGAVLQNTWLIYRLCTAYIEKHLKLYAFRRDVCLTYFSMYCNKLKIERTLGKSKKST